MTRVYLHLRSDTVQFQTLSVIRAADDLEMGRLDHFKSGYYSPRACGWRFYPFYQRRPSRKAWPTAQDALKSYKLQIVEN